MKAIINGQSFGFSDKILTVSKSIGIYECEFVFDDSWDEYDKTAVFEGSNNTIETVISNNKALVPWEVLQNDGYLKIGVYGTSGEKVKPTIWSSQLLVKLGTPTGSIGTEPTPSIYAQILEVANHAESIANNAYNKAETAQDSAKNYAEESEAWAIGTKNGEPTTDETYHNNSKWWAELAQQSAEESGYAWFDVNENTGEAIVMITDNLDAELSFEVNTTTGELEVIMS